MEWWFIATIVAYFVKGVCGFANTPVFTSILSLSGSTNSNNIDISPVDLLIGYPANIVMTIKERKSIRWKVALPLIALVVAGSIPGAIFLKNADTGLIKLIFGIVVILIAIEMLLRLLFPGKLGESKIVLVFIGVISGVMCGLYGIGALMSGYISRVTEDTKQFKANISMVFLAENTVRIITYLIGGIITAKSALTALKLMPFMLGGIVLGMFAGKKIPEKPVKIAVTLLLMFSGILLILGSINK